jgi:GNAT superfamily N-acetyltransferase
MTDTWYIRDYREGDEAQILELRHRVFGDLDPVRMSHQTWRWQFCDNPAGQAVCALAEGQGRIVGQYVVIPTRFRVQGKETLLALSCDTMIDADYRRRGLFTALAQDVYRRIESERRMSAVWGFPNDASISGFTRHLGWRILKVFPLRVVPLRPLALLRASLGLTKTRRISSQGARESTAPVYATVSGLQVTSVTRFGSEYDDLWKRYQAIAPVIQIRDAAYLNWRYGAIPGFGYRPFAIRSGTRLLGYMVIRTLSLRGHFFGVLSDMFPFPIRDPLTTQGLFRFAKDYCKAQGAEFMTCLLSCADSFFSKSTGLKAVPSILNPREWILGYRPTNEGGLVLSSVHNWYVTYGDSDII